MMTLTLTLLNERVGQEIAVGDWLEITQDRINLFADASGDRQWIHVDPVRAATESPFKTTIAHGFLTLSLVSVMLKNAITLAGVRMAVNYGVNRVRFITPVPTGSRIRGRFILAGLEETGGGVQATWAITIERDGEQKPACVVDWIVRYFPD